MAILFSACHILDMHERTKTGRGTLINPNGDPIKKVDYEITPDDSEGRLCGVSRGFLINRGWLLEDETNQCWSIEAMPGPVPDDLAKSWVDVVVRKAK